MKTCRDCKIDKPLSEYRHYVRPSCNFYSTQCKNCLSNAKKEWVKKNWYDVNESNKRYNKKFAHVISGNKLAKYWPGTDWKQATEKYEELLKVQNGVCAICFQKETRVHANTGTIWDLAVDHCHETKRVRGLLCNSCNRGLGLLDDTVAGITRALDYLKKAA